MPCSIVIPTHNRPSLLREAVASALAACPDGGEVLVVDDRSSTPAEVALDAISDARLKIIPSSGSPGICGTRNTGVLAARHPIVTFLDDDDLMLEQHVRRILAITDTQPDAHWGFSNAKWHDVSRDAQTTEDLPLGDGPISADSPPKHSLGSAPRGFWIRRDTFMNVGLFDTGWTVDEDTDVSLRLIEKGYAPWFSAEPGILMRVNRPASGDLGQFTHINSDKAVRAYRQTYERHRSAHAPFSRWRYFLATRYLRHAAKGGSAGAAAGYVLRNEPMAPLLLGYLALKTFRYRAASTLAK